MDARDFLSQILQTQKREGRAAVRSASEGSAWEALVGFYNAVSWTERNMLILLAVLALYACIVVRENVRADKSVNLQIVLFLTTCGSIWVAQYGNAFFAKHWRAWGWTQNYFDKSGVFVSSVYCAPLCLLAFMQLILSLREAVTLMIVVKRRDLKQKFSESKAAEKAAAASEASGVEPRDGKKNA
jgi:hypothetical protein